jgi:hypothetical protein
MPPPPLPSLLPAKPSDNVGAFNVQQMVCANAVGLLLAFVEWASSSPPNNNGGGSGGTITSSALTHLMDVGRVKLVNYSSFLHRLTRVVASPTHPSYQDDNDCNGGMPKQNGGGLGGCLIHN